MFLQEGAELGATLRDSAFGSVSERCDHRNSPGALSRAYAEMTRQMALGRKSPWYMQFRQRDDPSGPAFPGRARLASV